MRKYITKYQASKRIEIFYGDHTRISEVSVDDQVYFFVNHWFRAQETYKAFIDIKDAFVLFIQKEKQYKNKQTKAQISKLQIMFDEFVRKNHY